MILTEGAKTEPQYLTALYRTVRERVVVEFDPQTGLAPKTLVERAVQRKVESEREQKRGRGKAFDEVWCVFDRDAHLQVRDAKLQAADNGVRVAFSNPCFELWLLLHFQDQAGYLSREQAQAAAQGRLNCGKNLTPSALDNLLRLFGVAKARAKALNAKHAADGNEPDENPSSDVWQLVESMRTITL